jgi:xanthine dehydrogenase molybdopterin-binding subunit B
MSTASVEVCSLRSAVDGAYDVPAFSFNARVARCHLPPRATVRGPGKVSAVLLLEQVMQSIAQALGVDSRLFREAHLLRLPPDVLTAATARAVAHGDTSLQPGKVAVLPHPRFLVEEQQQPPAAARQLTLLHTALGARLELEQLTLPYMWQELARIADYDTRRADADLFNKTHHLRKRGLAMVPARYLLYHRTAIARVDVYADGSILLSHPGTEMGQGIGVKVMQAAAYCLGSLLPPGEAAALLGYMRVSGGSSELMPHAGVAAGSTTSEAATAAITAACEQLLEQLRPIAESQQAASVTAAPAAGRCAAPVWEALVAAAAPVTPILTSRVVLSATGIGGLGTQEVGKVSTYNVFGVAAAEVCLDVLTGERSLLRADLMYDAGASVNPAIDLGQCEGAFMQGVGHVLHEEVLEDRASGQVLSARSWTYKPPALADMPQARRMAVHPPATAAMHAFASSFAAAVLTADCYHCPAALPATSVT